MRIDHSRSGNVQVASRRALAAIDDMAGRARARYLTTAFGQLEVYREKAENARDYLAASADRAVSEQELAEKFPWIHAEVEATGRPGDDAARRIIGARKAFQEKNYAIERIRVAGHVAVAAARTLAAVAQARHQAKQRLLAL